MPLVVNRLEGRHTHTQAHTYQHSGQKQREKTWHMPATDWHVPGLKRKGARCFASCAQRI